ncbi:MAG: glycosyltransferase family 39 protein [Alphaproteobacteria bacterium]|nr:glycosyltransferase family 39 protein [Alphaproteobacteria bacterium]
MTPPKTSPPKTTSPATSPDDTAPRPSKSRLNFARFRAVLVGAAVSRHSGPFVVILLALLHGLTWTVILVNLKAWQDIHMDVAEAFGWGQKFLMGYGKHPPLAGWVAGVWFQIFPIRDWSTYALAMATVSTGMVLCWRIALHVVDRRRAFFVLVMLALYPLFTFKGFKFNPDLLQLVTLPLVVLAYLHAFRKRSLVSGVWLGLAAVAALLTKYWVLTMIGAIGLAALIDPLRMKFLRSPAPWAAFATCVAGITPHLMWLAGVGFVPLIYAGETYSRNDRSVVLRMVINYVEHNAAMLVAPLVLAALALALVRPWRPLSRIITGSWKRGANRAVKAVAARQVWIIQIIVAIGPLIGAMVADVSVKTDWGISLFFLVPLAVVAIPALRLRRAALFNITAIWLTVTVGTLLASPLIVSAVIAANSNNMATYGAHSELARELTQLWHRRFGTRWEVVAGPMNASQTMVFYSPDHPRAFMPLEPWGSGLTSVDDLRHYGFIAVWEASDGRAPALAKWLTEIAPNAQRLVMTTRRYIRSQPGPPITWDVYVAPPQ